MIPIFAKELFVQLWFLETETFMYLYSETEMS